ncbi:MAG TPA: hypothetical protein GX710_02495 [Clostridiales bacterium]|nr:hypothetical protein [Clostridiales bacterium]
MTVNDLIKKTDFTVINSGSNLEINISKPFCCDLLSIAMSKAPVNSAWVTVMGNVNTLAVAVLADVACIILAEEVMLDEAAIKKAKQQDVTVLQSNMQIFETALLVHDLING